MQRVELTHNYHVSIYCPFCGHLVKDMTENAAEPFNPCRHTLFIAHDEGVEYMSKLASDKLGIGSAEEAMESEDSIDELTDRILIPDAVKFAAYAGPPSGYGDYVGFAALDDD